MNGVEVGSGNVFADLSDWRSPQEWRYCEECEKNGFPVIREKPKSNRCKAIQEDRKKRFQIDTKGQEGGCDE